MSGVRMPALQIGDRIARVPILQGGMGVGVSLSGLASAVANAGGIGIIATAGIGWLDPDFGSDLRAADQRALRAEIRKARSLTDGIIGVNIMLASADHDDLLRVAVEENVDLVVMGAGLPLKHPETVPMQMLRASRTKFLPKVSSARAVRIIFTFWARHYNHVPDGVVLEGPLAGGHLGYRKEDLDKPEHALEVLLPQVVAALKPFEERFGKRIPVISGGGVFTGDDIRRMLELGAEGVLMGTRFVATHECDVHPQVKEAYIQCRREDLVIIDSPVGLPGRAVQNQFLADVTAGIRKPYRCPWQCLRTCDFHTAPYCIAKALFNAKAGRLDEGFAFAGANAYRVKALTSVKNLMESLAREYEQALRAVKALRVPARG